MARRERQAPPSRFGQARPFNKKNIDTIPQNKPVLYKGESRAGTNFYTGTTHRGRIQERLKEHLSSGDLPGVTRVRIKPMRTIADAVAAERKIIKSEKPKLNKT